MKNATTIEEQIIKLQQRGMILDCGEAKAKEVLSDIGYFRLGFYCFPFEKTYPQKYNRMHEYKAASKLSDVFCLYYLDYELRSILLKYINRVEINFRTKIIYTTSNYYPTSSTWFVDPLVMQKKYVDEFDVRVYDTLAKSNKIIQQHHKKHINDRYAYAWKTVEFLTFGGVATIYKNLRSAELKTAIAKQYGINNFAVLENYMQSIVELRNICAHGGVLFDFSLNRSIKNGPALRVNERNKHSLYSTIKVVLFMLSKISDNRANEMSKLIEQLFDRHRDRKSISTIIDSCIGYKQ